MSIGGRFICPIADDMGDSIKAQTSPSKDSCDLEKDLSSAAPTIKIEDSFPEGGKKAWLTLFGVYVPFTFTAASSDIL